MATSVSSENGEIASAPDAIEKVMIKKRSLIGLIILAIITLHIYTLYWIHELAKDVNAICDGDGENTRGLLMLILLSVITLGIYYFVWLYMLGDRLQANAQRYNLTIAENGGTVLLWWLLGSFIVVGPFIALHIVIKNTNALANEYNKKNGLVSNEQTN